MSATHHMNMHHIITKWCKIMRIRVAAPSPQVGDDADISTGHICGWGGSIEQLRHLEHHRHIQNDGCAPHATYPMLAC